MVFWKIPSQIKAWKNFQDEEEPHTQWDDLFFDLIFVGVAYNVGHLLEHSGPSLMGFTQCMMLFVIASKAWQDKVLFFSRFDVDDILHKALNAVEYCIVGVLACHITSFSLHSGQNRQGMRGFTALMLFHRVFVGFRWLEISYNAERLEAMNLGTDEFRKNIYLLSLDAFAVYLAFATDVEQKTVLFLCFFTVVLDHCIHISKIMLGLYTRKRTVPHHISYLIHRIGEFTMLMVGESVLSLSALRITSPTWEFYLSLVCGFTITSSIMFIQYSTSVFHAEKHVLRRSGKYGIIWFHVKFCQAFFLVTFGVGLRMMLQKFASQKPPLQVLILFCGSLSMNVVLAMLVECLQLGINPLYHRTSRYIFAAVSLNVFALFLMPYLLYFSDYSKFASGAHCVIYASSIILFQAICEVLDPNAKGIEGRFHHHIKRVTHAVTAVHHLRKTAQLRKQSFNSINTKKGKAL